MTTLDKLCARLAETLCLREVHVARHARALQRAGLLPEAAKGETKVTLEGPFICFSQPAHPGCPQRLSVTP